MPFFFFSIRLQHHHASNLAEHNARLNRTIQKMYGTHPAIDLAEHILFPEDDGLYRCRITYARTIETIELFPYVPRPIHTFRVIRSEIRYPYKSTDRRAIDTLYSQRGTADEILMVTPEGYLRDTSIANIALQINGIWFTPAHPLLPGTMREKLLREKKIQIKHLTQQDLKHVERFAVINAMVGFQIIDNPIFQW